MRTILCFFLLGAGWAHAQVKWEYATIESCYFMMSGGSVEGACEVVYATLDGGHEEVVKVSEAVVQSRPEAQGQKLERLAQQKTIARMGEAGWELVAVFPAIPPADRTSRKYFFKRKVEKK